MISKEELAYRKKMLAFQKKKLAWEKKQYKLRAKAWKRSKKQKKRKPTDWEKNKQTIRQIYKGSKKAYSAARLAKAKYGPTVSKLFAKKSVYAEKKKRFGFSNPFKKKGIYE